MSKQTKGIIAAVVAVVVIVGGYSLYGKKNNTYTQSTNYASAISYDCEKDKTAYTLLNETHEINAKDTSFGKQVLGIDGKNADETKEYWAFYVDGKLAPVGADAYNCAGTEKVEWKLESF